MARLLIVEDDVSLRENLRLRGFLWVGSSAREARSGGSST